MGFLLVNRDSVNESLFRDLFEYAPVGYQSLNNKGKILNVNQTWLKVLGYNKKEVIGKWFGDFLTEKSKENYVENFKKFLKNKEIHESELELVAKNNNIILASFEGRIYNDKGIVKTHCIFVDITKRRRIEKSLDESKKRYSKLVEFSPFGIAIHKMCFNSRNEPFDYIFLEVNPSFEHLTGLKKEDIINKKVSKIIPGIRKTNFIKIYGEVVLTGKSKTFEEYSEPLKKYFQVTAYSLGDSQFVTLFQDITESKKLNDQLKDKVEETKLFNQVSLDRELKMVELKEEIIKLKAQLKKK